MSAEQSQTQPIRLEEAVALARAGDADAARAALVAHLGRQPADADAWLWLACVTTNPWEAWSSLQKVLELQPAYPGAAAGLEWLQGEIAAGRCLQPLAAPFTPAEPPAREFARPWLPTLLGAILGFVIFGGLAAGLWFGVLLPQRIAQASTPAAANATPPPSTRVPTFTPATSSWEEAWNRGDWATAVVLLEKLSAQEPTNSVWRTRLFEARVRLGNYYAERNQVKEALAEYDRAIALRPYDTDLQQARGAASRYLTALERYQAGDWPAAVEALQAVYNQEGEYRDTHDLLYSAHYNLALAYQAAGRLDAAERELLAARPFARDPLDIEQKLAQVKVLKTPATPTPSLKRIEVDISEQRFYAYEADKEVYKLVCSTGNNASPTAPGSYRILDKIPMAYASTWNLQMPFWMGIYWSGTLENGIHALPILSNGKLLWDGFLGQRVSFGCVILSTQDAKTIYDWVDVGTSVTIRP